MTRVAPAPAEEGPTAEEPELATASGPAGDDSAAVAPDPEQEDEDHAAEMAKIRRMRGRGKRTGVSSDTSSAADDETYEKKYFPKTEEQLARIEAAVAHSFLFDNLNGIQKKEIFDAMFEKKVQPGEVIIQQGDDNADNFYIVDSGEFDCYVAGVNDDKPVVHYVQGGGFGELALMYNAPRAATIKCCGDGEASVWAVDRGTFRHVVVNSRKTQKKKYENMLKQIEILSNMRDGERSKLADALEPKYYHDGEIVIKEGDDAFEDMHFYLIEKGVAVALQGDDDTEVGVMTEGGYFGEKALIEHKPRAATVKAKGPLEVACLDCAAFERVMGPAAELMARAMDSYKTAEEVKAEHAAEIEDDDEELAKIRRMRGRGKRTGVSSDTSSAADDENYKPKYFPKSEEQLQRIKDAVAHSFLFDNLSNHQKKEIFDAMCEKTVEAGEVVIQQGDANAEYFYIVDSGDFDCYVAGVNDDKPVVHYKEGGGFGELALMYNAPRAATIKCRESGGGVLWAVDRGTFRHVVVNARKTQKKKYENMLKSIEILGNMSDTERSKLADALDPKEYHDGEVVIKEGDDNYDEFHFYLIERGTAVATQGADSTEVGVMVEGGYFGEKGLIEHAPRAATVTAKGPLEVACLDCAAFERVMGPCDELMKRHISEYKSAADVTAAKEEG